MSCKNAAAASTALSLAEYIDNYPGMPEGARAAMLLLKLDIVSCLHYAWREAHNNLLLRRSIVRDCLRSTLPPIDEDQKLALFHAPFYAIWRGVGQATGSEHEACCHLHRVPSANSALNILFHTSLCRAR